jgi:hypothetical protein
MDVDTEPPFLLREELLGHGAAVRSLCVSGSGELVSGGSDAVVNRWETADGGATTQGPQVMDGIDTSHVRPPTN